jgi:hypothetical protein
LMRVLNGCEVRYALMRFGEYLIRNTYDTMRYYDILVIRWFDKA